MSNTRFGKKTLHFFVSIKFRVKTEPELTDDIVMTHALEWPSLTVEWLPDKQTPQVDVSFIFAYMSQ